MIFFLQTFRREFSQCIYLNPANENNIMILNFWEFLGIYFFLNANCVLFYIMYSCQQLAIHYINKRINLKKKENRYKT